MNYKFNDKEVEKFMSENKFLKQAREELAYLSGDPDFQRLIEARAGLLMDMHCLKAEGNEEGRKEGLKEGRKEKQIEIARNLLKLKIPVEQIILATNLSKEEIEKL